MLQHWQRREAFSALAAGREAPRERPTRPRNEPPPPPASPPPRPWRTYSPWQWEGASATGETRATGETSATGKACGLFTRMWGSCEGRGRGARDREIRVSAMTSRWHTPISVRFPASSHNTTARPHHSNAAARTSLVGPKTWICRAPALQKGPCGEGRHWFRSVQGGWVHHTGPAAC